MTTENLIDGIVSLLGNALEGVEVIRAYPERQIQPRLVQKTVAVGFDGTELSSSSLDSSERSGEYRVFADIFVPASFGSGETAEIFNSICDAYSAFNILSLSAERISFDSVLSAYVLKTSATFGGEYEIGGADDE